ncbi:hypothetical protein CEK25_009150 [Fusarium fujikuroi]|nr:hypothetical protein CEK25_009150 [Fusarium fujikuroi]
MGNPAELRTLGLSTFEFYLPKKGLTSRNFEFNPPTLRQTGVFQPSFLERQDPQKRMMIPPRYDRLESICLDGAAAYSADGDFMEMQKCRDRGDLAGFLPYREDIQTFCSRSDQDLFPINRVLELKEQGKRSSHFCWAIIRVLELKVQSNLVVLFIEYELTSSTV